MNRDANPSNRGRLPLLLAAALLVFTQTGLRGVAFADDEPPMPQPAPSEAEPEAEDQPAAPVAAQPKPAAAIETARQISDGIRWIADRVRPSVFWMRGATLCSGVVVHPDGYLLTILSAAGKGAVNVNVNGKTHQGRVVASDPSADLALVKIDAQNLAVARLGDSDTAQVGDLMISVGSPFGFPQSVTTGIISYRNRKRKPDTPMLQNTIPMDANNVGAPLVNVDGEVVGVTWAIAGNNFVGIGYAVPINAFKQRLLRQLPFAKNPSRQ